MKRVLERLVFSVSLLLACGSALPATAQEAKPSHQLVAIYQVSAGKHLEFLKWMARQEAAAREAGGPATQWFMHENGASWDFVTITPRLEPGKQAEVDRKTEALAKAKGLATGLKASFEFRQYMGTHSDTFATGPTTVDELVKAAEKKD